MLAKSFIFGLAALAAANSAVYDLIPDNFDKLVLESGKPTLVEFFAPWCGHCKNLAPIYEELASSFAHAKDKVQIAKVDADAERDLGTRYGIQGFPTLKWFDGESDAPVDYNSGRDLESLTNFITEKTGARPRKPQAPPSNVEMLTDQTFSKAIGGDKNVIVAFTAPWCGHCKTLAPIWETLAEDFVNEGSVVIAKVDAEAENCKDTAQDQGVTGYPTIKFFPAGSTEPQVYDGGRDEGDFIEFLNKQTGTHRVVGGGLDAVAGTIPEFNAIAALYMAGTDLQEIGKESLKVMPTMEEDWQKTSAAYYMRVIEKQDTKGEGYVAKESARLSKMLGKGGLVPTKADELTVKVNILRQFSKQEPEGKDEL